MHCPPPGLGIDLDLPEPTRKELREFGDKVNRAGTAITWGLGFVGASILIKTIVSSRKPSVWKLFK